MALNDAYDKCAIHHAQSAHVRLCHFHIGVVAARSYSYLGIGFQFLESMHWRKFKKKTHDFFVAVWLIIISLTVHIISTFRFIFGPLFLVQMCGQMPPICKGIRTQRDEHICQTYTDDIFMNRWFFRLILQISLWRIDESAEMWPK